MITVLTVADDPILRLGLSSALQTQPDFSLVGETCQSGKALEMVKTLKPDAMVIDVWLNGFDGVEVIRQVKRDAPAKTPAIVALSMSSNKSLILEVLKAGASGYVLKGAEACQLFNAIREASAGRRYLSPSISDILVELVIQQVREESDDPYDALSPREREVFYLVAHGYHNNDIACRLSLGKRTVETYRAKISKKLGFRNNSELIRYAIKRGILPLDY